MFQLSFSFVSRRNRVEILKTKIFISNVVRIKAMNTLIRDGRPDSAAEDLAHIVHSLVKQEACSFPLHLEFARMFSRWGFRFMILLGVVFETGLRLTKVRFLETIRKRIERGKRDLASYDAKTVSSEVNVVKKGLCHALHPSRLSTS